MFKNEYVYLLERAQNESLTDQKSTQKAYHNNNTNNYNIINYYW